VRIHLGAVRGQPGGRLVRAPRASYALRAPRPVRKGVYGRVAGGAAQTSASRCGRPGRSAQALSPARVAARSRATAEAGRNQHMHGCPRKIGSAVLRRANHRDPVIRSWIRVCSRSLPVCYRVGDVVLGDDAYRLAGWWPHDVRDDGRGGWLSRLLRGASVMIVRLLRRPSGRERPSLGFGWEYRSGRLSR
jgi:hypothetical protein